MWCKKKWYLWGIYDLLEDSVIWAYSAMGLYVKASYSQSSRETCSLACFASGKHANQQIKKSAGHLSFAELVISPSPPTVIEGRTAKIQLIGFIAYSPDIWEKLTPSLLLFKLILNRAVWNYWTQASWWWQLGIFFLPIGKRKQHQTVTSELFSKA